MKIDRKFRILAINPINGKVYDENNSLLLCAKDAAVPAALSAYHDECVRIGANPEHIESIKLLLERVMNFQVAAGGGRTPDTVGAEIPRCLYDEKVNLAEAFAIGSPLGGGFFGGEMTIEGERYALIVAPKAEGEKMDLEYKLNDRSVADGTDSDDDGLFNTERITGENHPAARFCQELQTGGFNDWYLPSRDELAMLWRNLGPNRKNTPEAFKAGAVEAFETTWYWSSTEYAQDPYNAWIVGFYGGGQNSHNKHYDYGVRAVRRLKI